MYILDLAPDEILERLRERYPQMDLPAVKASMVLARCGIDLLTGFEVFLTKHSLTYGRFLVMAAMNRDPEETFTPTQLAESLDVSRATMTGLLDGLENAGLVERGIHAQDRRKMSVRLTPKGLQAMDEIMPELYTKISFVMRDISPHELEQFLATMGKVLNGLNQLAAAEAEVN